MNIKDVVALVTGGASGLGEATVVELVKNGAKVAIVDIDSARGEKLVAGLGKSAIFVKADVTSEAEIQQAMKKTIDAFGKINVAVSCAGVPNPGKVLSKKGPMPLDAFNKVVQINLVGTLNIIRLAAEQMNNNTPNEEGEKGVIINTASVAAFDGQIGQAAYSGSKAGIVGMTLPIARECADYGIRVATIAPGLFNTPMMASLPPAVKEDMAKTVPFPRRLGKPVEYAMLAIHIIENTMLNGCCIRLDGALRMPPK
ncbi:MAG: 3-hydroxy-2-methylbutyryl-CoA dehydrogenase [Deltaproteobacteria bacterium RBG_19FT_COMBO_43_11]|nr:MAG: 3-hydroxy-2-methylbutyryl-CoA dehydrogenase [Deltaproteobacteria bacterium RBG_16_44_11]OGP88005.1 MAG: 3-hydroxy-2-methylbutyryl-CoA dehydrogenase [Deltaproteobacteria bacterium RBG_19FT_COMBO_43_11]